MRVVIVLGNLPMWEQWAVVGLMATTLVLSFILSNHIIERVRGTSG